MPELPEVEVIRQFLDKNLINKTITDLTVLNPKSFVGDINQLVGQKIVSFSRLGKQLSFNLSNSLILLFHLKMTGQLVFIPPSSRGNSRREGGFSFGHPTPVQSFSEGWPNKSTRLIFIFSDSTKLYFNDQRKFGWVKLLTPDNQRDFQKHLGLDILDPNFTPNYFYSQLQKSSRGIKLVLLDQNKFAGIGNIYANDALFLSQIHPQTSANCVTKIQVKNLHSNLISLMTESIMHGGSTAKDNKYIHPDGSFGQHQYHFRVYQKEGEPCSVCTTPIKRLKIGGRSAFYCPVCQVKSNCL
jgi:formamidopyrimidine-DNA glycosylase